jgi:hypothetical protein
MLNKIKMLTKDFSGLIINLKAAILLHSLEAQETDRSYIFKINKYLSIFLLQKYCKHRLTTIDNASNICEQRESFFTLIWCIILISILYFMIVENKVDFNKDLCWSYHINSQNDFITNLRYDSQKDIFILIH